jgi:hypothetical protein
MLPVAAVVQEINAGVSLILFVQTGKWGMRPSALSLDCQPIGLATHTSVSGSHMQRNLYLHRLLILRLTLHNYYFFFSVLLFASGCPLAQVRPLPRLAVGDQFVSLGV